MACPRGPIASERCRDERSPPRRIGIGSLSCAGYTALACRADCAHDEVAQFDGTVLTGLVASAGFRDVTLERLPVWEHGVLAVAGFAQNAAPARSSERREGQGPHV